jgi:ABC-type antimicrobial peptide transport system permease subunit
MATYMTTRQTKEIGVRKIVGASIYSLWKLMSKEFVVLVTISVAIASPLTWYGLDIWLRTFTFRAPLSWDIFVIAGAGGLLITLSTVSWQLLKAARRNPVNALKSE